MTGQPLASDPLIGPIDPPELHVMTLNIRRPVGALAWRRADRWPEREFRVRALLSLERPALLCLQEAVPHQMKAVLAALGRGYRFVGYGRGRRRTGEGCPIVYDVGRLELLHWRQHALSATPQVPGSRSWGNLIPRIAVTARLRDRATAAEVQVANIHLDPMSAQSRVRSIAFVRSLIGHVPTIVAGDLNAGDPSPTVDALLGDGVLVDTWAIARHHRTAAVGTYGGYAKPRPDGARIDRIVVSDGLAVDEVAINARAIDGGWPSDHLPVQAVVRVGERGTA